MIEGINWYEEIVKTGLTILAAGAGAWLSIRFFPLKAKKDEWFWKKQVECECYVMEALSEIMFLVNQNLGSEYDDQFSMSGLSVNETETTVQGKIREIHQRSASLNAYLNGKQSKQLLTFLNESQKCMDEARQTHGEWHSDDDASAEQHATKYMSGLYIVAETALSGFKFKYVKNNL